MAEFTSSRGTRRPVAPDERPPRWRDVHAQIGGEATGAYAGRMIRSSSSSSVASASAGPAGIDEVAPIAGGRRPRTEGRVDARRLGDAVVALAGRGGFIARKIAASPTPIAIATTNHTTTASAIQNSSGISSPFDAAATTEGVSRLHRMGAMPRTRDCVPRLTVRCRSARRAATRLAMKRFRTRLPQQLSMRRRSACRQSPLETE